MGQTALTLPLTGDKKMKNKTIQNTLITLGILGFFGGSADIGYQATQGYKSYVEYADSGHKDQTALQEYKNEIEEAKRGLGITLGSMLIGSLGGYIRSQRRRKEEEYENAQTKDLIMTRLKKYTWSR